MHVSVRLRDLTEGAVWLRFSRVLSKSEARSPAAKDGSELVAERCEVDAHVVMALSLSKHMISLAVFQAIVAVEPRCPQSLAKDLRFVSSTVLASKQAAGAL